MKKFSWAWVSGLAAILLFPALASAVLDKAEGYVIFDDGRGFKEGFGPYYYDNEVWWTTQNLLASTSDGYCCLTAGRLPKVELNSQTHVNPPYITPQVQIGMFGGIRGYAEITWYFQVSILDQEPKAPPDTVVRLQITISGEVGLSSKPASEEYNYAEGGGFFWSPETGAFPFFEISTKGQDPPHSKAQVVDNNFYTKVNNICAVHIWASNKISIRQPIPIAGAVYDDDDIPFRSANAYIDPVLIIDPKYMINIGGVDYPATQLVKLELSPDIGPFPTSTSSSFPWLDLLLGD